MLGIGRNKSVSCDDPNLTIISQSTCFEGTLGKGNHILINGFFKGTLSCSGKVTVNEGAFFKGRCFMEVEEEERQSQDKKPAGRARTAHHHPR